MLETEIRTLIFYSEVISLTVFCRIFFLVDRTNAQHSIIIKGAFGSWGEEGAAAGESDGITGAPSLFQLDIQFTHCICVSLIGYEIDFLCGINGTETNFCFSLF